MPDQDQRSITRHPSRVCACAAATSRVFRLSQSHPRTDICKLQNASTKIAKFIKKIDWIKNQNSISFTKRKRIISWLVASARQPSSRWWRHHRQRQRHLLRRAGAGRSASSPRLRGWGRGRGKGRRASTLRAQRIPSRTASWQHEQTAAAPNPESQSRNGRTGARAGGRLNG